MPKISNNFYGENLYTFTNFSCFCNEDTIYETPGSEPKKTFKVFPDLSKPIKFAYAAKKGLVRINDNGTIVDENILGQFVGLATASQKKIEKFFNNNGFLYPLSDAGYEAIDFVTLLNFITRMKLTVELMSEIGKGHKNYNQIINLSLQLIRSEPFEIKTQKMELPYTSCKHSFMDLIKTADMIQLTPQRRREKNMEEFFCINDTIFDTPFKMDINEYNEITSTYSNTDDFFKAIVILFVNYNADKSKRQIIDFLFHYFRNSDLMLKDNMKNAAENFAKSVLKEEINHNLTGIHPVYNTDNMEPAWEVDSLMSALYFSLFYLKPKMELYRPCGNPKCTNYFLISATSSKTKYCSTRCTNNMTQARYRKKKSSSEL